MTDLKVLMVPHLDQVSHSMTAGINRVVAEYFRYLPLHGIELVHPDATDYDIKVSHAGSQGVRGDHAHVAMTHGVYWTADHDAPRGEYKSNQLVIDSVRHARQVTVPSRWVAEAFQRDMKFTPHIVPHGIRADEWLHNHDDGGYILWNKNRVSPVCDPIAVTELALAFPDDKFATTFARDGAPSNVHITGVVPHHDMMRWIQSASVYLSTTKETFGIGVLEAMAAGVPVLGWAQGGNLDLVSHGINGYLAETGNYEDLAQGLAYCLDNRKALGLNGQEIAREYTWEKVAEQVAAIYRQALVEEPPTVSIVIPTFNYGDKVGRAIDSAVNQTYDRISSIVVVDDGTPDDGETRQVVEEFHARDSRVHYVRQRNSGVAEARNRGIRESEAKYICCLDADDAIEPTFIERLVPVLEADRSIGIAYTGLRVITANGRSLIGKWPGEFIYEKQLEGHNQIPTACLFRKEMWRRLGGYRQRYAPLGCGAEDAEFWLRAGSIGYGALRATPEPLFIYSMGTGGTSRPDYEEVNWLAWSPWTYDDQHPFASVAKPAFASHPVRQYDEPIVSVIIPVGPNHHHTVIDAIDSVEAQTFRKWELIVVDDTGMATDCDNCDSSWLDDLLTAYPYLRVYKTPGGAGAGYARNRGVELSRAPLLLYLDADDFLKPYAIEEMLIAHAEIGGAIYTDYEAHATGIDISKVKRTKVKYHDASDGYTVLSKKALDYDWTRVQTGIENPPYIWNLITTLFPKSWHYEIGGFDEAMPSWEDYDYWVRLAYLGKPFTRLPQELVVYLYHTGSRREEGHQIGGELIHYLRQKREGVDMSPCPSCNKRPTTTTVRRPSARISQPVNRANVVSDDDFVLIEFRTSNLSQTHIYGTAQFESKMQIPNGVFMDMIPHHMGGWKFYYGYHGGGERFLVHRRDAEMEINFEPVEMVRAVREIELPGGVEKREPPPPPPIPTRMTVEDVVGGDGKPAPIAPPPLPPVSPPSPPPPAAVPPAIEQAQQNLNATLSTEAATLRSQLDALPAFSYDVLSRMLREEVHGSSRPWAVAMIRGEIDKQQGEGRRLDGREEVSYSGNDVDFQSLPGVGKSLSDALKGDGYETIDDILSLGVEGLRRYKGVGEVKAKKIVEAIEARLRV